MIPVVKHGSNQVRDGFVFSELSVAEMGVRVISLFAPDLLDYLMKVFSKLGCQ